MSFRDSPFSDIKVPLSWAAAAAVAVALVAAVILLMSDRRETLEDQAYGRIRETADRVQEPISTAISAPVRWGGAVVDGVHSVFGAIAENPRLRREVKRIPQLEAELAHERDINERYRALLSLKTDPPIPMISGRTITDSRGPFANSRLINVGREAGVKVGYPVMSENGLVGRVVGVGEGVSRILLLTDIASRTPVMIDRNNARAILTGDGGPHPKLDYLRSREPPKVGDVIVTSGDGGVMPRGLPVGVAVKGIDGAWRAQLASDTAPIDIVRILKFEDFAQLADERELTAPVLPREMSGSLPPPVLPPKAKTETPLVPGAALKPGAGGAPTLAPATGALKTPAPAPKTAAAAPAAAAPPQPKVTVQTAPPPQAKAPAPKRAAPRGPTTRSASGNVFRKVETPDRPQPKTAGP